MKVFCAWHCANGCKLFVLNLNDTQPLYKFITTFARFLLLKSTFLCLSIKAPKGSIGFFKIGKHMNSYCRFNVTWNILILPECFSMWSCKNWHVEANISYFTSNQIMLIRQSFRRQIKVFICKWIHEMLAVMPCFY